MILLIIAAVAFSAVLLWMLIESRGALNSAGGMLNFTELTVEHFLPQKDYVKSESSTML